MQRVLSDLFPGQFPVLGEEIGVKNLPQSKAILRGLHHLTETNSTVKIAADVCGEGDLLHLGTGHTRVEAVR